MHCAIYRSALHKYTHTQTRTHLNIRDLMTCEAKVSRDFTYYLLALPIRELKKILAYLSAQAYVGK